jgi:hypothetical protein
MTPKYPRGHRQSGGCEVALAVMACVTHLKHTIGSVITVDAARHL